jgi:hypothetical protein
MNQIDLPSKHFLPSSVAKSETFRARPQNLSADQLWGGPSSPVKSTLRLVRIKSFLAVGFDVNKEVL